MHQSLVKLTYAQCYLVPKLFENRLFTIPSILLFSVFLHCSHESSYEVYETLFKDQTIMLH